MNEVIIAVLLANLLLSAVYMVVKLVKKQSCSMVLLFLVFPVLGFVLYFVPGWISKTMHDYDYDRDTLVKRLDIERSATGPLIDEELDVVPIEDAMAVSENDKKRSLLLRQLKKDYVNNYKELLSAENDQDSESAHYIAAAKMEIYSVYQKKWTDQLRKYEEDPSDANWISMIDTLSEFIDSDLLSNQEKRIYKKKYIERIEEHMRGSESWDAYAAAVYMRYLGDLNRKDEAITFWNQNKDRMRSEKAYMTILSILYDSKKQKEFRNCICEIKEDKETQLSPEGLSRLRYWISKDMDKAHDFV